MRNEKENVIEKQKRDGSILKEKRVRGKEIAASSAYGGLAMTTK